MDLKEHREKLVKQHGEIEAEITRLVTARERTVGAIAMIDEQLKEAGPTAVPPKNRAARRAAAKAAKAS